MGLGSMGGREVALEAARRYCDALEYSPAELKGDREFMLKAVKQYGSALEYSSAEL